MESVERFEDTSRVPAVRGFLHRPEVPCGRGLVLTHGAGANCAYGVEVLTLADYPAWLVTESPDVYGTIAPRLNLPMLGEKPRSMGQPAVKPDPRGEV